MSVSVKQAVDDFLLSCKVEGKSYGTIECYQDKLSKNTSDTISLIMSIIRSITNRSIKSIDNAYIGGVNLA